MFILNWIKYTKKHFLLSIVLGTIPLLSSEVFSIEDQNSAVELILSKEGKKRFKIENIKEIHDETIKWSSLEKDELFGFYKGKITSQNFLEQLSIYMFANIIGDNRLKDDSENTENYLIDLIENKNINQSIRTLLIEDLIPRLLEIFKKPFKNLIANNLYALESVKLKLISALYISNNSLFQEKSSKDNEKDKDFLAQLNLENPSEVLKKLKECEKELYYKREGEIEEFIKNQPLEQGTILKEIYSKIKLWDLYKTQNKSFEERLAVYVINMKSSDFLQQWSLYLHANLINDTALNSNPLKIIRSLIELMEENNIHSVIRNFIKQDLICFSKKILNKQSEENYLIANDFIGTKDLDLNILGTLYTKDGKVDFFFNPSYYKAYIKDFLTSKEISIRNNGNKFIQLFLSKNEIDADERKDIIRSLLQSKQDYSRKQAADHALKYIQNTSILAKDRMEFAKELCKSDIRDTGVEGVEKLMKDDSISMDDRLRCIFQLLESKDDNLFQAGFKGYIALNPEATSENRYYQDKIAKFFYDSKTSEIHDKGIDIYFKIASNPNIYEGRRTEIADRFFKSSETGEREKGIVLYSIFASDPRSNFSFSKRFNLAKTVYDADKIKGLETYRNILKFPPDYSSNQTDYDNALTLVQKDALERLDNPYMTENYKIGLNAYASLSNVSIDQTKKEKFCKDIRSLVLKNLKDSTGISNKTIKEFIFGLGMDLAASEKIKIIKESGIQIPTYQRKESYCYFDYDESNYFNIFERNKKTTKIDKSHISDFEEVFKKACGTQHKDYNTIKEIRKSITKKLYTDDVPQKGEAPQKSKRPLFKTQGISLSQEFTVAYKKWLNKMIEEEVKHVQAKLGLKEFPKFSILSLGSLARGEALLFSDLEFIFLVEKNDENSRYILNLLNQRIVNRVYLLGEDKITDPNGNTIYPTIKSEKAPNRPFIGIHADTECDTPPYTKFNSRYHTSPQNYKDQLEDVKKINLEQLEKIKPIGSNEDDFKRLYFLLTRLEQNEQDAKNYEKVIKFSNCGHEIFIVTPTDLALYALADSTISDELESKKDFKEKGEIRESLKSDKIDDMITLLRNTDLLYGDDFLFKKYRFEREQIMDQKIPNSTLSVRQTLFLSEIENWLKKVGENKLILGTNLQDLIGNDSQYNAKNEKTNLNRSDILGPGSTLDTYKRYFYRPIEQLLSNLAFLYNLEAKDTMGIIQELESEGIFTPEMSKTLAGYMNVAFTLRLRQQAADMSNTHTDLLMTNEELVNIQGTFINEFLRIDIPNFVGQIKENLPKNPQNYTPLRKESFDLSEKIKPQKIDFQDKDKNKPENLFSEKEILQKDLVSTVTLKNTIELDDYSNISDDDFRKVSSFIMTTLGTQDLTLWKRLMTREINYGESDYHVLYQGNDFTLMLYYETIKLLQQLNQEPPLSLRAYSHIKISTIEKFWEHYFDPIIKERVNNYTDEIQNILASNSYDLLYENSMQSCVYFYKSSSNMTSVDWLKSSLTKDIIDHFIDDLVIVNQINDLINKFTPKNKNQKGGIIQTFIKKEKLNSLAYLSQALGTVDRNYLNKDNTKNNLSDFLSKYKTGEEKMDTNYDQVRLLARSPLLEDPVSVVTFYDYDENEQLIIEKFKKELVELLNGVL